MISQNFAPDCGTCAYHYDPILNIWYINTNCLSNCTCPESADRFPAAKATVSLPSGGVLSLTAMTPDAVASAAFKKADIALVRLINGQQVTRDEDVVYVQDANGMLDVELDCVPIH